MRILALSLLLAALAPWAIAQRGAGATAHGVASSRAGISNLHSAGTPGFGRAVRSSSRFRRTASPHTSLPFPFFGDVFDSGDIYSTGYPVASDPPAFLLQGMQNMAGSAAGAIGPGMPSNDSHRSSSTEPLVIELQEGRYVRVHSTASNGEILSMASASQKSSANAQALAISGESAAHDFPAAVLVFRDGHSEEVRDYTIAGGALYARGNFYTDGYWNKKIDLAALDLPQTTQANASRSVKFVLPASPNEVITRP